MTAGHIDYEALVHEALRAAEQEALRKVVRAVLQQVARSGLTHDHHFYIAFNTQLPGVSLSKRLREKYPAEMTIVLQHRFWDLEVADDRFEVKLTFDGIPERLGIPLNAIKVFYDPSVPYGLQFEDADAGAETRRDAGSDSEPQGVKSGRPRIVGGEPEGERAERRGERGRPQRPAAPRGTDPGTPTPAAPVAAPTPVPAPAVAPLAAVPPAERAPGPERTPAAKPAQRPVLTEVKSSEPAEASGPAPPSEAGSDANKVVDFSKFRKK